MESRKHYIVGPVYDWLLFLSPPLVALAIGIALSGSELSYAAVDIFGYETTVTEAGLGVLIHAHLVAVAFRSHANPDIFGRYPVRFVVVPLVLWLAIAASLWMAIIATVVATFWDVWHSGAQTFGFGRIYDRNAGVPSHLGRRLDFWANQVLYAGPILAGVTLIDHVEVLDNFGDVEAAVFERVPATVDSWQGPLAWFVIVAGTLVIGAFVLEHGRRWRAGLPSSPLKIYLVATTGLCSIYSWGLNSWGEAFLIMNLFHGVQYLGLVWASERGRIRERFGLGKARGGQWWALALFVGLVFGYGVFAQLLVGGGGSLWALTIVVSLMHFWYDGFVWSVRAKQI